MELHQLPGQRQQMTASASSNNKGTQPRGYPNTLSNAAASRPVRPGSSKTVDGRVVPYGYIWWPMEASAGAVHQGAFRAIGIFGQYLYIHPREQVVIAQWSALPKPRGFVPVQPESFFGAVVAALG